METSVYDVIVSNQLDITQIETKLDRLISILESINDTISNFTVITLKFYDFLTVVICIFMFLMIVRTICGIFK